LLARTSSLCPSREPAGLEFGGALLCPLVPGAAGLGLTKPRPGVEQHQRLDHRGMGEVEGERHIAAERETADDRALDPAAAQQCLHVLDGQRLGIGRGIVRVVGLAVAAHIPEDDPVVRGEGGDLSVPHPAGGAIAVAEQDSGAVTVLFVIDLDAIAIEEGYVGFPYARRAPTPTLRRMRGREWEGAGDVRFNAAARRTPEPPACSPA